MPTVPAQRKPRIRLAVTAAVAATAVSALGAWPASAATSSTATSSTATSGTGVTLSISPRSGSDYSTDAAKLSWTVPSACVGQEVDAFLYKGTATWDTKAINTAEGNNGGQQTFFSFSENPGAAATGSASWPNVSPGYYDYGYTTAVVYPTTADLVAAQGTGYYTIAIACVNSKTYTPITNSSGFPIASSFPVDIGATGNSWKASYAIGTQIALTGSGTVGTSSTSGKVSLTAHVTASNHSVPVGAVNFYAGASATGTPLNGSTPVPVGSTGEASYSGPSGYAAGDFGAQEYYAEFVPANPARYTPTSVYAPINLIKESVTLKVTATQDPLSATSVDLIAKGTGTPHNLVTEDPSGGVDFIVDGTVVENDPNPPYTPFQFNSNGIAAHIFSGLKPGTHTFSALLVDSQEDLLNPSVGYVVKVNTVKFTVK